MDFFGFHPLYVVILLALALIIFGPSRLPKMGAQMGRMLREFQAAREGLTQQMRDAFEEEPETDFGASGTADEDEETEPASEGPTVAVLDPPPDGQNTPEAQGTAVGTPSHEVSLGDEAAAGVTAALQTPVEDVDAEEPETAAALHTPVDGVTAEEPETTTVLSPPVAEEATVEEPESAAATLEGPAETKVTVEPDQPETESPAAPGSVESATGPVNGGAGAESSATESGDPLAPVAAHHDATAQAQDEERRADE